MEEKQKPVHKIRYGNIEAAIWANETDNGTAYRVSVTRHYLDSETWKSSGTFGKDDLLVLAKAVNEAHTWIYNQK
jgi:hypothetical protein